MTISQAEGPRGVNVLDTVIAGPLLLGLIAQHEIRQQADADAADYKGDGDLPGAGFVNDMWFEACVSK